MLSAAGEDNEPESLEWSEAQFYDLPVKDDQLLAKQGTFGNQFGFSSG
jgi:hypothetical protein